MRLSLRYITEAQATVSAVRKIQHSGRSYGPFVYDFGMLDYFVGYEVIRGKVWMK